MDILKMFILAVWLRCYHRAKDKNKKSPPIWVGEDFYSFNPILAIRLCLLLFVSSFFGRSLCGSRKGIKQNINNGVSPYACGVHVCVVMHTAIHNTKKGGRKSMKAKKIVALLLASAMTISLMACGGGGTPAPADTAAEDDADDVDDAEDEEDVADAETAEG